VVNSICERVIGTMRRECLDFVIPLNERHLYGLLKEWVTHYNEGRPHMSLEPGISRPKRMSPVPRQVRRHRMLMGQGMAARPVLGGLHHDYQLEPQAA
jgi:transposase InsO family protein